MKQDKIHDALNQLDDDLVESVDALRRKKRKRKVRLLRWGGLAACLCAAVLAVLTPLWLSGGASAMEAVDLMEGIKANSVAADADLEADAATVTDFAVRLFQNTMEEGENTLISPLSVLCALAMTANGAEGETLAQMEETLGLSIDELNAWIHTYMSQLPENKKYKLSLANSIWFTADERFTVEQDFLQTNADYYSADIYKAPFDDSTLKDINTWVKEKTDGMIQDILDEIPKDAVMYLVNALAFDAEWQDVYFENQVRDGIFTTEDGTKRDVELMHSAESRYLEDGSATGFIKYYKDGAFAFAALLPNEGVSVADYAASLSGEHLHELLSNPTDAEVITIIPKFETEYSVEMSDILTGMGMTDAFDWTCADFSGLGVSTEGNIFIDRVLHKTFISVDERGTKAGAATVVAGGNGSDAPVDIKTVTLDRPFVYMLIDCETDLPFFIGTMMDTGG